MARYQLGDKPGIHTGRPISQQEHEARLVAGVEESGFDGKSTEYSSMIGKIKPEDTSSFNKTGGFTEKQPISPKPFISTSSYQSEILDARETARRQLKSSEGVRSTMVQYEAARQHRPQTATEFSSPRSITSKRAGIAMTPSGEIAGYQTTTGNSLGSVAAILAQKRSSSFSNFFISTQSPEPRWKTLPPAMAPGMFSETPTSKIDYGIDGSDPADKAAPSHRQMSRLSTTKDLNEGSVRNTNHLPGYTGHTPCSKYHVKARIQADAVDVRSPKHQAYAFSLDQFVRGGAEVPGLTLFKPQSVANRKVESKTPTVKTTYGEQNANVTKAILNKTLGLV